MTVTRPEVTPTEVARRWFTEVWNGRDASTIEELMHPSSSGQTHAGVVNGPTEWREKIWEPLMSAFSNLAIESKTSWPTVTTSRSGGGSPWITLEKASESRPRDSPSTSPE